jgi:hypothetical protein
MQEQKEQYDYELCDHKHEYYLVHARNYLYAPPEHNAYNKYGKKHDKLFIRSNEYRGYEIPSGVSEVKAEQYEKPKHIKHAQRFANKIAKHLAEYIVKRIAFEFFYYSEKHQKKRYVYNHAYYYRQPCRLMGGVGSSAGYITHGGGVPHHGKYEQRLKQRYFLITFVLHRYLLADVEYIEHYFRKARKIGNQHEKYSQSNRG